MTVIVRIKIHKAVARSAPFQNEIFLIIATLLALIAQETAFI